MHTFRDSCHKLWFFVSYDRVGATCSRRSSDERVTVHVVTQDVMLVEIVANDESDNCLEIRF